VSVSQIGSLLSVDLTELPADYDLCLYSPYQTLIACSVRPGVLGESLDAVAEASGYHYVRVFSPTGTADDRSYTLRASVVPPTATPTPVPVSLDPGDPTEPNDSYLNARPIASGQTVTARIHAPGDLDFFRIEVNRYGALISATLDGLPANYDLYLDGSDQTGLAVSANHGTEREQISWWDSSGVWRYFCYVIVASPSGEHSDAFYTLRVTVASATATTVPTRTPTPTSPTWTPTSTSTTTATPTATVQTATPTATFTATPVRPGGAAHRPACGLELVLLRRGPRPTGLWPLRRPTSVPTGGV